MTMTKRRIVVWTTKAKRARHASYAYTVADIAKARNVTPAAVRQAMSRGTLVITDLLSVARYVLAGRHQRATTVNHP